MALKLSRVERWILSNQYRILETLYPGDAKHFAHQREALESGYALEYEWMAQHIYEEKDTLSVEDCREVIQVLDMFTALQRSYAALDDKASLKESDVMLRGWDGNNETAHMAYARHCCEMDGGRFTDLKRNETFNSHMPSVARYHAMLGVWKVFDRPHELTREQMAQILSAREPGMAEPAARA